MIIIIQSRAFIENHLHVSHYSINIHHNNYSKSNPTTEYKNMTN